MKYFASLGLFLLPLVIFASPVSVNRITDHIEPLNRADYIKGQYFTATSTTATSTFPRLKATTAFDFLGTYITNVSTWFNGLFDTQLATKSTTNLSEGTNLYYTTARVNTDAPNVTLAGTPDYITIAGQVITRGLIDLATDITGVLPSANVSTSTLNILHSNLLGLGFTSSGHTGTAFRLFGTNSAGTAAEYATSTLKINHSDLAGLGFTSSGHTGTAFRLFGTNSAGSASEYATSTLKLLSSDILEGATNLFYTDTRVNTAISASTTVAHATPVNGNVLLGNGTNWTSVATTSLGFDAPHAPVTLAGQNYLTLSGQQITANQITLSGTHVTGVLPSANVSTSTLNINHSNLKGLAWTDSAHTGTAFNLAGFTSAGVATNYATSSLKITIGDVTGLGTGVATFLQTPSSSNLVTAITDETGSGALVFGTQPVFSGDITTPRVNGSSAASGSLALTSTSDSSKGLIYFGTALSPVAIFDELNGRLSMDATTNTAKLYIEGSTGSGSLIDVASSTLSTMFVIKNNGLVGIGTSTPEAALDVFGTLQVSNSAAASAVQVGDNTGTYAALQFNGANNTSKDFIFQTANSPRFTIRVSGNETGSDAGADMSFNPFDDSGSGLSSAMVIKRSNGFIGMGVNVANTATKLFVRGADNATIQTNNFNVTNANCTASDTFIAFTTSAGTIGSIACTATAGLVAYNTFTGSHWTVIDDMTGIWPNALLLATGEPVPDHDYLSKAELSCEEGSKRAYGVFGGTNNEGLSQVLSIGTGKMWVANEGEDLRVGDLLMSSDLCGHVEKQHGFFGKFHTEKTVAKVMTDVVWEEGERDREVGVVYFGG